MRRLTERLLFTLALIAMIDGAMAKEKILLVTQDFPPLQVMTGHGEYTGFVIDFMKEVMADVAKENDIESSIMFAPWKRAMLLAESQPNVIFFSLSRTPERETKFHWLGWVAPYDVYLYKLSSREDIQAKGWEDILGKGYSISVQSGSNFEELLKRKGIGFPPDNTMVETVVHNSQNIMREYRGFTDLMMQVEVSFPIRLKEVNLNPSNFEKLFRIEELSGRLWAVVSPKTSDAVKQALQKSFDRLKAAGRDKELMRRYFVEPPADALLEVERTVEGGSAWPG
ncbi:MULTISPECIES: ABC transporter substrate-binding protein [unclassified Hahella]|uniref:substrate-binding periplasmic protein n=1 Tax=unclassified Hahella TaxID=2624107 RepID=UPI001C1E97CA|nr:MULTISPECIES: transporter substrate-binding domain-containing protein [unclassified Hahella]MBU6954053.1 transporter substrate-binding domain-containing protein [Hahella sp. HN01]MDG9668865.1 transporter substrate-binding domain-containing protein [Hahella sp. CR1]